MELKFTLRQMLARPGRFIVLLLCIFIASIAAFLAFDMGSVVEDVIRGYMTHFMGNIDFVITNDNGITPEDLADCPECRYIEMQYGTKRESKREERLYTYELTDFVSVLGFPDLEAAYTFGMFPKPLELSDDEVAICRKYSESYGYEVGDTITLTDQHGEPYDVTVAEIFEPKGMTSLYDLAIVSTAAVTERQMGSQRMSMVVVDVLGEDTQAFKAQIEENLPAAEVEDMTVGAEMEEMIQTLNIILYLVFILTFLLVIFVTVSFSEKIIQERMSTIGTLRSIGISRRKTTFLLLFENALYGLIGSAAGCAAYLLLRPVILSSAMTVTADEELELTEIIGSPSILTFAAVIGGAVLIELLVPLFEVLRAVKTPIRDIIFANQDTQAQVSPVRTAIGCGLLLCGLVLGLLTRNAPAQLAAILLLVIGAALAVPAAIRGITVLLRGLFGWLRMPVAEFAALEAGTKKANMGNAVLAVTTITAAAAIFNIGTAMLYWTNRPLFTADVIVGVTDHVKTKEYEFLQDMEDVAEVEYFYQTVSRIRIGDDSTDRDIIRLPDGGQVIGVSGVPETLGIDEMYMDEPLAERYGMQIGDTVTVTFREDGVFPIEREMTLTGYCNSLSMTDGGCLLLGGDLYKELFQEYPSMILLRSGSGNADALAERLTQVLTDDETVQTLAEKEAISREDSKSTRRMLYLVIGLAMVLTLIGISGNRLVGFEGRRRELALLHSTAMPRAKLVRLLLLENAISFGISVVLSALLSLPVTAVIANILRDLDTGILISSAQQIQTLAPFILVIWAVVMLTVISPVRKLCRMNTANEIKYE